MWLLGTGLFLPRLLRVRGECLALGLYPFQLTFLPAHLFLFLLVLWLCLAV